MANLPWKGKEKFYSALLLSQFFMDLNFLFHSRSRPPSDGREKLKIESARLRIKLWQVEFTKSALNSTDSRNAKILFMDETRTLSSLGISSHSSTLDAPRYRLLELLIQATWMTVCSCSPLHRIHPRVKMLIMRLNLIYHKIATGKLFLLLWRYRPFAALIFIHVAQASFWGELSHAGVTIFRSIGWF